MLMGQSQIDDGVRGSAGMPNGQLGLGVLVVDDDEAIRSMLSECLAADGHAVTLAGSAAEALAGATRHAFDLVLLDLRLGEFSGLDLIPRLLAESPWATVVVITAFATIGTAVEAIKRGASDYLAKPVSLEHLRQITQASPRRKPGASRARINRPAIPTKISPPPAAPCVACWTWPAKSPPVMPAC